MKRTKLDQLLDVLCVELGFCLPLAERARLVNSSPGSVKAFTDAVFVAEGLDPISADKHLWSQVRDRVNEYLNEVEARDDA